MTMTPPHQRKIVVAVVAVLLLLTTILEVSFVTAFSLQNHQPNAQRQVKFRNVFCSPSVTTPIGITKSSNRISASTTTSLSLSLNNDVRSEDNNEGDGIDGTIHQDHHNRHDVSSCSRRSFWRLSSTRSLVFLAAAATTHNKWTSAPALAKEAERELILPSRLDSGDLTPPTYGIDGSDVYYPSWMTGTWMVESVTTDVQAPCGMAFFGGDDTYRLARADMGPDRASVYEARFVPTTVIFRNDYNTDDSDDNDNSYNDAAEYSSCVADREYNVKSIAKGSLGSDSMVMDVNLAALNHFTCSVLSPSPRSSPTNYNNNFQDAALATTMLMSSRLLKVDLLILQRRQEFLEDGRFACSEVVREIVTPASTASTTVTNSRRPPLQNQQQQSTSTLFREVETISLYTPVVNDVNDAIYYSDMDSSMITTVHCLQRSASFLAPRRGDPRSIALWKATQGRPVDVRWYDVTFKRQV